MQKYSALKTNQIEFHNLLDKDIRGGRIAAVTRKLKQYASVRLSTTTKRQVEKLAAIERRTLSSMFVILVDEALGFREHNARQSEIARATMETYGKMHGPEAEGL